MSNCIFCMIANHEIESSILYEDELCLVILDLSQATYGHSLVMSKQHFNNLLETEDEVVQHMFLVAKKLAIQIKTKLNAAGINILTNAGKEAGQTVEHVHIHIIPRYDDNDGFHPIFENHQGEYDLEELKNKIVK